MTIPLCCSTNPSVICYICHERWCKQHWDCIDGLPSHLVDEGTLGCCPATGKMITWGIFEGGHQIKYDLIDGIMRIIQ